MTAASVENPYAGQGPVLLDVGADSAALVITCPEDLVGAEIGFRRIDGPAPAPPHDHGGHSHSHSHDAHGPAGRPPHVGVVRRPVPSGRLIASAVFPDLSPGTYRFWVLPDGPVQTVRLEPGLVTAIDWVGR